MVFSYTMHGFSLFKYWWEYRNETLALASYDTDPHILSYSFHKSKLKRKQNEKFILSIFYKVNNILRLFYDYFF